MIILRQFIVKLTEPSPTNPTTPEGYHGLQDELDLWPSEVRQTEPPSSVDKFREFVDRLPKGPSVDLRARAFALKAIMEHKSHSARLAGAAKVRAVGGNKFDERYIKKGKNPGDMVKGMKGKNDTLAFYAENALDVLSVNDGKKYPDYDALRQKEAIRRALSDYDNGAALGTAKSRNKIVQKAMRTAKNSHGQDKIDRPHI